MSHIQVSSLTSHISKNETNHYYILFITMSFSSFGQSNRWAVSGTVQDEKGNGLPSATITLLDPKDSTLVTFGVSNPSGGFEIKNLRDEALLVQVSFVGFETFHQKINKLNGNLFSWNYQTKGGYGNLDEFTIEAIAPVTIKKDTVEFHADAFKIIPMQMWKIF